MNKTSATTPTYLKMHVFGTSGKPYEVDMELQNPDTWDFANAVIRPANEKRARSILSVAFAAEQFEAIGKAAERRGKKVSAFVREAALRAAKR